MAEFGIKATELAAPQGAGSAPIAGVRGVVEQGVVKDYTLPSGLLNVAEQFGVAYAKDLQVGKTNPLLSDLSQRLGALSQGVEQGVLKGNSAMTKARAEVNAALTAANGNPELEKAIREQAQTFFGVSNLATAQEQQTLETEFNKKVVSDLQEWGVQVVPNPSPQLVEAYGELHRKIKSEQFQANQRKAAIEEATKEGTFSRTQADEIAKGELVNFVSNMLPTTTETLGKTAVDLKTKIENGEITVPQAALLLKNATNSFRQEVTKHSYIDSTYTSNSIKYLDEYEKSLIEALDPKFKLEALETRLKTQSVQDQNFLLSNGNFRAYKAVHDLFPNNPQAAMGINKEVANLISELALRFDYNTPVATGTNVNKLPSGDRSIVYGKAKESLQSVSKALKNGQIDTASTNNMVNNLLAQSGAMLDSTGDARASDLQDFISFVASDEFRNWKSKGELSPEALRGAQSAAEELYARKIQQPVFRKLTEKIPNPVGFGFNSGGQIPAYGVAANYGVEELPAGPELRYIDLFEAQYSNGRISFVLNEYGKAGNVTAEALKEFKQNLAGAEKTLNTLLIAGFNLSGESNLDAYYEKTKAKLIPIFDESLWGGKLKVGEVKDGKRYKGGNPYSVFSWEPADGE